jgi:hypothetical protein
MRLNIFITYALYVIMNNSAVNSLGWLDTDSHLLKNGVYRYYIFKFDKFIPNGQNKAFWELGGSPNGTAFDSGEMLYCSEDKKTMVIGSCVGDKPHGVPYYKQVGGIDYIIRTNIIGKLDSVYSSRYRDEFIYKCGAIFEDYLQHI